MGPLGKWVRFLSRVRRAMRVELGYIQTVGEASWPTFRLCIARPCWSPDHTNTPCNDWWLKTAIFSLHKCLGKNIGRLKSILPAGRVGQFVAGEREDVGGILCATSANEHERIPCLSIHTSPKHFYFIRKNVWKWKGENKGMFWVSFQYVAHSMYSVISEACKLLQDDLHSGTICF